MADQDSATAHRFPYRTALVTGGAGFIGSHVVEALVRLGCETTVLDDLSAGSSANLPAGVRIIEQDVADPRAAVLVAKAAPELVIHAAAQVSVPRSMADPARDREVNLIGTAHVLQGATKAGAKRFVFISSGGAVYGEARAADESRAPAPENYYGLHKLAAEGYVRLSGLSYGIVRYANVYGPRQRTDLEGGVVAIFLEALRNGRPVTIYGDGSQRRDLLFVDDAVTGLLAVAAAGQSGTWNVATGVATTVNELLADLEDLIGKATAILRAPPRAGDVAVSSLAIDRIRDELGWSPRYSLTEGIRQMSSDPATSRHMAPL